MFNIMNKLTIYPFLASASTFGATAFVTVLLLSVFFGMNPMRSDDPYIIGFALASFNTMAALIFFILREIKLKWLEPEPSLLSFYLLLIIFSLFVEYKGGEGAGYGYIFLISLALSSPILLIFIFYSKHRKLLYIGMTGGLIYFFGYLFISLHYYI